MEFLERLEQCAEREALEETGLRITNTRFEWLENSFIGDREDKQHYVTVFMRGDLTDKASCEPTASLPFPGCWQRLLTADVQAPLWML